MQENVLDNIARPLFAFPFIFIVGCIADIVGLIAYQENQATFLNKPSFENKASFQFANILSIIYPLLFVFRFFLYSDVRENMTRKALASQLRRRFGIARVHINSLADEVYTLETSLVNRHSSNTSAGDGGGGGGGGGGGASGGGGRGSVAFNVGGGGDGGPGKIRRQSTQAATPRKERLRTATVAGRDQLNSDGIEGHDGGDNDDSDDNDKYDREHDNNIVNDINDDDDDEGGQFSADVDSGAGGGSSVDGSLVSGEQSQVRRPQSRWVHHASINRDSSLTQPLLDGQDDSYVTVLRNSASDLGYNDEEDA